MVGTEVEDQDVVGQLRGDLTRRAVRQREHDDVVADQVLDARRQQHAVREGSQVRLVQPEDRPRVGVRRERSDLDLGVPGQQPEHLPSRVPGSPGNRHCDRHMQNYT
ncbi:hypothetical protein D3C74_451730 [compost metagenome]